MNLLGCPTCKSLFRIQGLLHCPREGARLETMTEDPLEGLLVADRYQIERCIGEGGMGRVYRARHKRMSRMFAVKVLYGDVAADTRARERFEREAEAASRLSHANVVAVVDFGETPAGLLYLVMDYAEGVSLRHVLKLEAPLAEARVRRLFEQMCRGLAHAHSRGLVHRDFKPDNIIVTHDAGQEIAKIVDFGLAMLVADKSGERLTTAGMVVGTPAYMAPEQSTAGTVDHRTDLFSLGVVLYEMLAGVLPFSGDPMTVARMNIAAEAPPISQRVSGLQVDATLEAIAHTLMAKRPEQRPQSADRVLAMLNSAERAAMPLRAGHEQPQGRIVTGGDVGLAPTTPIDAQAALSDQLTQQRGAPPPEPAALVPVRGQRRRGLLMAGAAALVLATGAGVYLRSRAPAASQPKSGPDPAALAVAAGSSADAGTSAPPDATPEITPDAAPKLTPDAALADAAQAVESPPSKRPTGSKSSKTLSKDEFVRLYDRVGQTLQALERKQPGASSALAKRYLDDIPYTEALNDADQRQESAAKLRRIEREARRLLKR